MTNLMNFMSLVWFGCCVFPYARLRAIVSNVHHPHPIANLLIIFAIFGKSHCGDGREPRHPVSKAERTVRRGELKKIAMDGGGRICQDGREPMQEDISS
jgi:hypothetical protein